MRNTVILPRSYANYTTGRMPVAVRTDFRSTLLGRTLYTTSRFGSFIIHRQNKPKPAGRRQLALLIAAHNEELVIEQTIRSAMNAGMAPDDIYVVDDNSDDNTTQIVASIISQSQVVKVGRSGKGLALTKATEHFKLCDRYEWIHIADADGGFAPDYFEVFRKKLNTRFAAATGYVCSLPGGSVSQYRVVEYTLGMEITRRFQALTNSITIIPGPTSCFRSDVFATLNFATQAIAEDFDVTMQLHRRNLGKIQFIPEAIAYTQDPKNIKDYSKQVTRWNRGVMQGMRRHHVGRHANRIDAYLLYQVSQNFMFMLNYLILVPIVALTRHSLEVLANVFLIDLLIIFGITAFAAAQARRGDILSAFPQIYLFRWISVFIFLRAFIEVVILRKFRITTGTWETSGRRYKSDALLPQAS